MCALFSAYILQAVAVKRLTSSAKTKRTGTTDINYIRENSLPSILSNK